MSTWGISGAQFLLLHLVLFAVTVLGVVLSQAAGAGLGRGGRPGPPRPL
jgi:hypothetical protein